MTSTMGNRAEHIDVMEHVIDLPAPPQCAIRPETTVTRGDKVVIELCDGRKIIGKLEEFDAEEGTIHVIPDKQKRSIELGMHEIRLMRIPKPKPWIPDESTVLAEDEGVKVTTVPLEFEIEFNDHSTIDGTTLGFRNGRHGMHLFPVQDQEQYTHLFIPNGAIQRHRIGRHIGAHLVKDKAVSEQDVTMVLLEKKSKRSRPLGEKLAMTKLVTMEQLEHALCNQKGASHAQIGEILLQEGLITNSQLSTALAEQKGQRNATLSELLIAKKVVGAEQVKICLFARLGIPLIDLDQIPVHRDALALVSEEFAKQHGVLALHHHEGKLVVAMEDPTKRSVTEALENETQLRVKPVIATAADITSAIDRHYAHLHSVTVAPKEQSMLDSSSPAAQEAQSTDSSASGAHECNGYLSQLLKDAAQASASHIHLESRKDHALNIRLRIDGALSAKGVIPTNEARALIDVLRAYGTPKQRNTSPTLLELPAHCSQPALSVLVAHIPTVDGDDFILKLEQTSKLPSLNELDLSDHQLKRISALCEAPKGMILVCGPTDAGKSTTLTALLNKVSTPDIKAWSLKETGQVQPPHVRSLAMEQVADEQLVTLLEVLKHTDPNVIHFGELDDPTLAKSAAAFAMMGNLVLASLSTRHSVEALERLLNMQIPAYEVADAVAAVLTQRLARRLCPHCKQRYLPTTEELRLLAAEYIADSTSSDGGAANVRNLREKILGQWQETYTKPHGELPLFRALGCQKCNSTGYSGRIIFHELLDMTPAVRRAILDGNTTIAISKNAMASGMKTIKQDGIEKVLLGHTDILQVRIACT